MKDKKIYLAVALVVLLLLLSPLLFKAGFSNKVFTSQETYFNLIQTNKVDESVTLIEQLIKHNPFHVLLNILPLGDVGLAILVPLITGLISIILIFFLLRKINLSNNETTLVIILLVLTPVFIHKFTTLNPDNFAFPLLLLVAIFYLEESYLATIPLIFLSFINPLIAGLVFLFMVAHLILKKTKKKITVSLMITSFVSLSAFLFLSKESFLWIQNVMIDDVLIELGSVTGYSVPLIILGIIGLFNWWEKGSDRTIIASSLFVAFFVSIFISEIRLLTALVISIFAGIGINHLISMEWELKKIKQISLLLIFCIILFSAILTMNTHLTQVTQREVDAANFLHSVNSEGKVLSTKDKGFMIQYLSGKETFLNGRSHVLEDYEQRISDANQIFYSRMLSDLEELLKSNDITYLFIHNNMKNGEVWSTREEGLQFFLIHSDLFLKLFDNQEVQIYKYVPEKD